MKKVVTLPSISAIRSAVITEFFLLGSNNDAFGRLSSKLKFGTVSLNVAYMGFHSP